MVRRAVQRRYGPQAFVNRADIKVDAYLVVLQGNEGQSEAWIAAVPELEGDIQSRLGESVARVRIRSWGHLSRMGRPHLRRLGLSNK